MKNFSFLFFLLLVSNVLSAQTIIKVNSFESQVYIDDYAPGSQVIIDGRSGLMFDSGHIKNAVNIDAFAEDADEKLGECIETKRAIVYCTKNNRANAITEKLRLLNYHGEIVFLVDGISAWKMNGFDVVVASRDNDTRKDSCR